MMILVLVIVVVVEAFAWVNPNPYSGSHGPVTFWLNELAGSGDRWPVEDRRPRPHLDKMTKDQVLAYKQQAYSTSRLFYKTIAGWLLVMFVGLSLILVFFDIVNGTSTALGFLGMKLNPTAGLPDPKRHQIRVGASQLLFDYKCEFPFLITTDTRYDLKFMDVTSRRPYVIKLRNGTEIEFVPRSETSEENERGFRKL